MTSTTAGRPVQLAVGLTDRHVLELLGDQTLLERFNFAALSFAIVGTNRLANYPTTDAHTEPAQLDTGLLTATLKQRARSLRLIAAATIQRDHPYSLARRIASLDVLAGGRTGLLLDSEDAALVKQATAAASQPRSDASANSATPVAWQGIDGQVDIPLSVETVVDAAEAIVQLWQSWPRESIIADKEAGVYTQANRIRNVEHEGVYRIHGPISVPTSAQQTPVLAGLVSTVGEHTAPGLFDLLLASEREATSHSSAEESLPSTPVFEVLPAGYGRTTVAAARAAIDRGRQGLVVTPSEGRTGLIGLLDDTLPALAEAGIDGGSIPSQTLRATLGIPFQPDRLVGKPSAFAAPAVQSRL
ncbi:LLM class oxidoreductase [Gulosibacter chungangensis]|uniref:LLM class flavin-dependent oxidoreductase n=1 Tax=Gulosibacter chungangensis TaxID=979746 RepID=A0A7J5B9E0_9MICO|nr:LLM class flavin-dependent oxidoreductase [Gulosibacter chungangensis]KAB1642152.1 LLM class flavin-dependent oxidoreductase [Gulosibacter chungangensis]